MSEVYGSTLSLCDSLFVKSYRVSLIDPSDLSKIAISQLLVNAFEWNKADCVKQIQGV